jgi:hypothetical protein
VTSAETIVLGNDDLEGIWVVAGQATNPDPLNRGLVVWDLETIGIGRL